MHAPVYLDHLTHALGETRCTVEESAAAGRLFSSAAALREAGFVAHAIAAAGTSAYDLALRALAPLAGALDDVDAIVYATTLPANANMGDERRYRESGDVKHLMEFPVSRLQAELRLPDAQLFGLTQQACTGFVGAIRVARALIHSEPDLERVLCLTADRFPPGARYEQAYNLISDGAAACIVGRRPASRGFRVLGCHAIHNGALALASDDETMGQFFPYAHRLVTESLARVGLPLDAVRFIVAQNTNLAAWRVLASLLRIDIERVRCPTLPEVAHMISGDNVANLRHLVDEGALAAGDKLLLVMAGYGLSWQSLLVEKE
jgi:3-oxoacyl-[acyl-carrier-protein] synthase III